MPGRRLTAPLLSRFRKMKNTPRQAPLSSSEAIVESGACWGLRSPASPGEAEAGF
jgi:hypothetical protein